IGIDAAAVPEGVIPAPRIAAAPAEPRMVEGRAPTEPAETTIAEAVAVERVLDVTHLATVHAVAELDDHVRALRACRGLEAARLELLGDNPGIPLELEPAII